jgi:hypothetical protein
MASYADSSGQPYGGSIAASIYDRAQSGLVNLANRYAGNEALAGIAVGKLADSFGTSLNTAAQIEYDNAFLGSTLRYQQSVENLRKGNTLELLAAETGSKKELMSVQGELTKDQLLTSGQQDRLGVAARGEQDRLGYRTQGEQDRLGVSARGQEDRLGVSARGEQERLGYRAQGEEDRLGVAARGNQDRLGVAARGEQERLGYRVQGEENRLTQNNVTDNTIRLRESDSARARLQGQRYYG